MHNFYGVANKVNTFRKGLNLDRYDEPTYLTFSIDFGFDVPAPPDGDLEWQSPLFADPNIENHNSARKFLGSIGHKDKEENLKVFKGILEYLTFYAPWYFQSISGLEEMWTKGTDITSGSKETSITINTLEAIDLRITELASLYRGSIYDKQHLIERLPDNLRWFTMDIYVAEVRNIRYTLGGSAGAIANTFGITTGLVNNAVTQFSEAASVLNAESDFTSVLKQFGYVKFKCRQCEFDFSKSFSGGSQALSVGTSSQPAENSFAIKIGYFEEESKYQDGTELFDNFSRSKANDPWSAANLNAQLSNALNSTSNLPLIGPALSNAQQTVQQSLETIGGLINPSLGAANKFVSPSTKFIGDIYPESKAEAAKKAGKTLNG